VIPWALGTGDNESMKIGSVVLAIVIGFGALVWAQNATTGAIQGVVSDGATGEKLAGVTVIVTSPALASTQTAITDENGFYKFTGLPPGEYLVTFYYLELTIERSGVFVGVNKTTPVFQKLNAKFSGGETITIQDTAPTIDPTSTTQGITLSKNYIKNVPVPGRTFQSALGSAAGAQYDGDLGHNTESYDRIDDNPFDAVSAKPLSTFSIDVDTASYANTRRFLRGGVLPPRDAVRVEELINYFRYDYPAPAKGSPFSITTEVCRVARAGGTGLQAGEVRVHGAASGAGEGAVDRAGVGSGCWFGGSRGWWRGRGLGQGAGVLAAMWGVDVRRRIGVRHRLCNLAGERCVVARGDQDADLGALSSHHTVGGDDALQALGGDVHRGGATDEVRRTGAALRVAQVDGRSVEADACRATGDIPNRPVGGHGDRHTAVADRPGVLLVRLSCRAERREQGHGRQQDERSS
jgi:hypothetical protein